MYLGCNYRPSSYRKASLFVYQTDKALPVCRWVSFSTCLKLGQHQCIRLHLIQQGLHHASKLQAKHYRVHLGLRRQPLISRLKLTAQTGLTPHQKRLRVVSNICMSFSSTEYIPDRYITLLALWWLLFKASCPCYLKFTVAVSFGHCSWYFSKVFKRLRAMYKLWPGLFVYLVHTRTKETVEHCNNVHQCLH